MHAYHLKYQSIGPCPFDKEIMNGTTKKPSVFGCSPRCGVHYLNDTPEIKQDYLNRFLELQKKGYYSNNNCSSFNRYYRIKSRKIFSGVRQVRKSRCNSSF